MTIVNGVASLMGRASAFVARFGRARRGNVAMIFAIIMPILTLLTVAGVDIHRASTVRANLQDALDAAALAAARSPYVTDEELKIVGMAALKANLAAYQGISLREADVKFTMTANKVIISDAVVDVKAIIANIVLPPYGRLLDETLPVGAHSEVNRASKNIEVGLVLDITGSMAGQRMIDLKDAAAKLVDIVVQDTQTPYYTHMAIVPYSMGVNLGGWANGARGTPITATTNISAASWAIGSAKTIVGISRANPGVVTSTNHGFVDDQYVWISGVNGMTQANNRAYRIDVTNDNQFRLKTAGNGNVNTSGWTAYSSGGTVRRCQVSDCSAVVTSNGHGLATGEGVRITGVNGMTHLNDRFIVTKINNNTFSTGVGASGVSAASSGAYTSGGSIECGRDGCAIRVFRNPSNDIKLLNASTCVSERTQDDEYTDASPSVSKVGRNYPTDERSGGNLINPCPNAVIQPLTSNKTVLKDLISGLPTVGSTAGQIGMAWGWYTVSPNFNGLWSGNTAGPYAPDQTVKSVIIMTDGEYNTPYCTGVIAQNAGTGSGGNANKVNCNGDNGDVFQQGEALCDGMKAKGIVVYTVGFQIAAGGDAAALLADCATSTDHAYLPANGGDLSEAFAAIGRDITRLRISK